MYAQLKQCKMYHSLTSMLSCTTNPLQVSLTTLPVRSASAFRASPSRSHRSDPGSVHCPRKAEVGKLKTRKSSHRHRFYGGGSAHKEATLCGIKRITERRKMARYEPRSRRTGGGASRNPTARANRWQRISKSIAYRIGEHSGRRN